MDGNTTYSQTSRKSTVSFPYSIQHKQSKLDLLDSSTLTSFPLPKMNTENSSLISSVDKMHETQPQAAMDNEGKPKNIHLAPVISPITYTAGRVNAHPSEDKGKGCDPRRFLYKSKTMSSLNEKALHGVIDITTKEVDFANENQKSSVADSFVLKDIMGSSKVTTPPSSLDYQSPFYDYRLVLEKGQGSKAQPKEIAQSSISNCKSQKLSEVQLKNDNDKWTKQNLESNNDTPNRQYFEHSTDLYIQSIYNELNGREKQYNTIRCHACNILVFKESSSDLYLQNALQMKPSEIKCEDCIHADTLKPATASSDHNNSNNNKDEDGFTEYNTESKSPFTLQPLARYTSIEDTDNTIQIMLDTTVMSNEDDNEQVETTEYRQFQNVIFFNDLSYDASTTSNSDNGNTNKTGNKFVGVIKSLKRIERNDLKLRQSIADFRTYSGMDEDSSIWSAIKRSLIKLG